MRERVHKAGMFGAHINKPCSCDRKVSSRINPKLIRNLNTLTPAPLLNKRFVKVSTIVGANNIGLIHIRNQRIQSRFRRDTPTRNHLRSDFINSANFRRNTPAGINKSIHNEQRGFDRRVPKNKAELRHSVFNRRKPRCLQINSAHNHLFSSLSSIFDKDRYSPFPLLLCFLSHSALDSCRLGAPRDRALPSHSLQTFVDDMHKCVPNYDKPNILRSLSFLRQNNHLLSGQHTNCPPLLQHYIPMHQSHISHKKYDFAAIPLVCCSFESPLV